MEKESIDEASLWYSPKFDPTAKSSKSETKHDSMSSEASKYSVSSDFENSSGGEDSSNSLPKILKMSDLPTYEEFSLDEEEEKESIKELDVKESSSSSAETPDQQIDILPTLPFPEEEESGSKNLEMEHLTIEINDTPPETPQNIQQTNKSPEEELNKSASFSVSPKSSPEKLSFVPANLTTFADFQSKMDLEANMSVEEHVGHLKNEMEKQEHLIQGYQNENEKLYVELKETSKRDKVYINKMETENQALRSKLVLLQEQMNLESRAHMYQSLGISPEKEQKVEEVDEECLELKEEIEENKEIIKDLEESNSQLLLELSVLKKENKELKEKLEQEDIIKEHKEVQTSETYEETSKAYDNFKSLQAETFELLKKHYESEIDRLNEIVLTSRSNSQEMVSIGIQCKSISDFNEVETLRLQLEKSNLALLQLDLINSEREKRLQHQIEVLKTQFQMERQQFQNFISPVELVNKLETQKVMCEDLKQKLSEAQTFKTQCKQLEKQNDFLHQELVVIKEELKALSNPKQTLLQLQTAVHKIELKVSQREKEIDAWLVSTSQTDTNQLKSQLAHCKQIILTKNKQIQEFRTEIDQIVLVLEKLKMKNITNQHVYS